MEHIAGSNMVVTGLAARPSEGGFGCAEEVIPFDTAEGQEILGEGSNMYALLSGLAFYCLSNASSLMDSYLVELARSQKRELEQIVELPRPKSSVAGFESANAQLPNLARGAVTMQSGTMGGGRSLVQGVGTWKQFFHPGAKVMGEAYAICFGGQLPKVTLAVLEDYLAAWEKEGFPVSFKQRFLRESGDDDEDKSEYPIFVANFSSEADVDLAVAFLRREGEEKNWDFAGQLQQGTNPNKRVLKMPRVLVMEMTGEAEVSRAILDACARKGLDSAVIGEVRVLPKAQGARVDDRLTGFSLIFKNQRDLGKCSGPLRIARNGKTHQFTIVRQGALMQSLHQIEFSEYDTGVVMAAPIGEIEYAVCAAAAPIPLTEVKRYQDPVNDIVCVSIKPSWVAAHLARFEAQLFIAGRLRSFQLTIAINSASIAGKDMTAEEVLENLKLGPGIGEQDGKNWFSSKLHLRSELARSLLYCAC